MSDKWPAPTIEIANRRVWVTTVYGHPVVDDLKDIKANWDASSKRWWVGVAKRSLVEQIVERHKDVVKEPPAKESAEEIKVVGRATYKGRTYYVRWHGMTKTGVAKARLVSLDGSLDFWANLDGDVRAEIVKLYDDPKTLKSMQEYVEEKKGERQSRSQKPDEECYQQGGEWLVRGCHSCKALGRMCKQCAFDIYDN